MTSLITGANRGIGLALAQHLAAKGESIVATHRGAVPASQSGITWQHLDVVDPASHADLTKRLDGLPLDLLVCNAGIYLEKGDTLAKGFDPAKWAATFAVNVTGVFLTVQHLLPNLRTVKGKIAIISSAMGSDARAPGGSYIYRASKAAALNLGRNLAAELRRDNIAVGIYHPGWVRTDMGSSAADIDTNESATGLLRRFEALSQVTTGCFESYDGTRLEF